MNARNVVGKRIIRIRQIHLDNTQTDGRGPVWVLEGIDFEDGSSIDFGTEEILDGYGTTGRYRPARTDA